MSKTLEFEVAGNEEKNMRIGGMSFLPDTMEWPINPNGEKMVLILNIPTNLLNDKLGYKYPPNMMISVFTTYNTEDYFLDTIVYHGSSEELNNIKNGFTKVILHDIGAPRNDSDYLIPARRLLVGDGSDYTDECGASLFGGVPVFLQAENLEVDDYQFCLQIYGGDFPEEFQYIFYLNDSMGYLFLKRESDENDIGIFFTQCS